MTELDYLRSALHSVERILFELGEEFFMALSGNLEYSALTDTSKFNKQRLLRVS